MGGRAGGAGQGGGGQGKGEGWRAGGGRGFNRTNAHGGRTSRRDTVTFTGVGDDHSDVVTLLSENNDDHNNTNNNKTAWKHKQAHRSVSPSSGSVTALISLCSTPPHLTTTRQQAHGDCQHVRSSQRSQIPNHFSSSLVYLVLTWRRRAERYGRTKNKMFVFVSLRLCV